MNSPIGSAHSVQLAVRKLAPLFKDVLKLSETPLSPFAQTLAEYTRQSEPADAALQDTVGREELARLAAILARPDLRIDQRFAGTHFKMSAFTACFSREHGLDSVAVTMMLPGDAVVLRLFKSFNDYLRWWTELLASKASQSAPNYLPPPLDLESLLYILHATDLFRRASLENLLAPEPAREPFVRAGNFVESMSRSIQSKDLRWLLPSFLTLTPGVENFSLQPRTEHLKHLIDCQFLIPARHPKDGESIFYFGEPGTALGMEFLKTWEVASGLQMWVASPRGVIPLHQAFLAPTILSNHFIQLNPTDDGGCVVNHQAMSIGQLAAKFEALIMEGLDERSADRALQRAETLSRTAIVSPRKTEAPKELCANCGKEVEISWLACPWCGKSRTAPAASIENSNATPAAEIAKIVQPPLPRTAKSACPATREQLEGFARALQAGRDSGQILPADFKRLFAKFKFKDEQSRVWTVSLKTGKWNRLEAGNWKEDQVANQLLIDEELLKQLARLPPAPLNAIAKSSSTPSTVITKTASKVSLLQPAIATRPAKTKVTVQPNAPVRSAKPVVAANSRPPVLPIAPTKTTVKPQSTPAATQSPARVSQCPNPKCRKPIAPNKRFCTSCGTKVS